MGEPRQHNEPVSKDIEMVVGKLTTGFEHMQESMREIKEELANNREVLIKLTTEFAKTRTFLYVKTADSQKDISDLNKRLASVEVNGTMITKNVKAELDSFKKDTETLLVGLTKKESFNEGSRWAIFKVAGVVAFIITIVFNLVAVWFRTQPILIKWFGG